MSLDAHVLHAWSQAGGSISESGRSFQTWDQGKYVTGFILWDVLSSLTVYSVVKNYSHSTRHSSAHTHEAKQA